MPRSQARRRAAFTGLALVLLVLTGVSVLGTVATRHAATASRTASWLAEAYHRAHEAVSAQQLAQRQYRLEPERHARADHADAANALDGALKDIEARGAAHDRTLVAQVRTLQRQYLAAAESLFLAIDRADPVSIREIDEDSVDPLSHQVASMLRDAEDEQNATVAATSDRLEQVEELVFVATLSTFAVGLAMIVVFGAVATGYQRRLVRQAMHDELTGLPNRAVFTARTTEALDGGPSVLMLDLDRFKEVNDTLGHQYGDELLRQVAARTAAAVRATDTVARLAGDEFAILLPATGAPDATRLAERIQASLHRSFDLDDVTVDIEVSIGVASAPQDDLIRCADIAMYAAKDTKTGIVAYQPALHTEDSSRLQLLGDLRRALDADDQITLHYQPKVSLADGAVCGVEALVRWRHPERGPIAPADFIPVAETTGLITRLTLYVLRHALAQARDWLDAGRALPVAVNLSPRCLLDPGLVEDVTRLLAEFRVPAGRLRLEVTESAVMANPALATATLRQLHELGVHLSIDDYGTGYSSMAYLKALPVDELKVDRTFVQHMDTDHDDAVLVRGAIELGHNLGMTVVAEGVETEAHAEALRALGCDIAQGYHYARPLPAEDLELWLHARHPAYLF
ncbi:bifunctional diguanylate cyclase/phosphodiesterase [Dactylosporangium vinaceum]|uniref:Bifunctional diguanylate cyclase/phosphodiesterase n=1 Tax=Dactylosporangium vinaceum TaxID=53362 RepID=A0ABV5MRX0_9ACTN|nr:bifunctional diguanylate cyclase/phosphodiesterase [Dactylosporangium vinaceum]UAC00315.1 bifunctional diguanylate cyclase/phosphodiesterase [Dactylosporangium vinaceum]